MKILFHFVCILSCAHCFGQISGKITSSNGEAISFANVVLYSATDSNIVAGSSTNNNGVFLINNNKSGDFYLQISSLGYKTLQTKPFAIAPDKLTLQLEEIVLYEENNALDEVTIAVKKNLIQNTPTGKIINIQSSLLTKGSNALQVLERLPGVISDRRNNQFSLNGQSSVTVLFNGRRVMLSMTELMNLLESTSADNIEKIELITSPTAQYDADGSAGIINIIFKKSEDEGTKINLSATAGWGFREKAIASLNVSHSYKKAHVFVGYTFSHDVSKSGFEGDGTNDGIGTFKTQGAVFSGISRDFRNNHNLNFASEYRWSNKTSIGSDMILSLNRTKTLANNNVIWSFTDGDYLDFRALSDGKNKFQNLVATAYCKHKFSENSSLNIDANYIRYTNNSPSTINADYFDKKGELIVPSNSLYTNGNRSESLSTIRAGIIKIDFSKAFNNNILAEIGLKASLVDNRNDSKIERKINQTWELDPRSQSLIEGKEWLGAAYAQIKWAMNSKSNVHAGIRYENWHRNINTYNEAFKIAQIYPSLVYTYNFSEQTRLNINYNRRISRPSYTDLISNLFYNDPTFIFTGNPLLKPTISDAIKAEITQGGLNIGLSYQHDVNPILRYQITANESKDIGILSPQNMDYQKSLNLFFNYPFYITDWWRFSASSTSSWRNYKISYSLQPAEKTFIFQNFSSTQNITLPKQFEIELSGWYNLPFFEGTNSIKGFGVMGLGIGKELKNNKGSFQLSLPDVFQSFKVRTHISGMTPIAFNINTVSRWQSESVYYQVVKLSYARSFSKANAKKMYESSLEERERM